MAVSQVSPSTKALNTKRDARTSQHAAMVGASKGESTTQE
jgi:hypothetical protein